jgi:hypothetical protein
MWLRSRALPDVQIVDIAVDMAVACVIFKRMEACGISVAAQKRFFFVIFIYLHFITIFLFLCKEN